MPELAPGTVIDGRYVIVSRLGEGGASVVYEALHQEMKRAVALKILKALLSEETGTIARFRTEAQVMNSLHHPNIVSVYSIGIAENQSPYIALELLDGHTLSEMIKTNGALPYVQALPLFIQVCAALEHAHSKGIIHRDIKPSNFLVIDDNGQQTLKVLDFGIAKILDAKQALTRAGVTVGSILYMSPEQCEGLPADARSDIYSVGCSLFETVAGCPPFLADTALQTALHHREMVAPAVNTVNPDASIPDNLQKLISCCLQKDPDNRFRSVSQLRADLENLIADVPLQHVPAPSPERPKIVIRSGGRKTLVACLIAGLAVVLVTVLAVSLSGRQQTSTAPDSAPDAEILRGELRARTAIVNNLINQGNGKQFDRADTLIMELEELRPQIHFDKYTEAVLLRKKGEVTWWKSYQCKDPVQRQLLLQTACDTLLRCIEQYDAARKEDLQNRESVNKKAKNIDQEQFSAYGALQMCASEHGNDRLADWAAEKVLQMARSDRDSSLAEWRADSVFAAFDRLMTRSMQQKQYGNALKTFQRELDLWTVKGSDATFIERQARRGAATIRRFDKNTANKALELARRQVKAD